MDGRKKFMVTVCALGLMAAWSQDAVSKVNPLRPPVPRPTSRPWQIRTPRQVPGPRQAPTPRQTPLQTTPGFTGMSNDALRNRQFVTESGQILDGNMIRSDLAAFSTNHHRRLIAARKGLPLPPGGEVNGVRYMGDTYRRALIARYDRMNAFLNMNSLGRRADLLNGWKGTTGELATKYNIRLRGRESHRQIARRIAQNGRTHNDTMTSTIIDNGTQGAVVHARRYALHPDRAAPGRNIPIFRRIEGTPGTRGFNMTNQAISYFREQGYFLTAGGLRTEVVSATARSTRIDGRIFRYIEVIERVIP